MWKKIGVALIALIGTCSVAYAMNQRLNATGSYQAGGNVTGTVDFKPGDRFYSDTKNPKNNQYMEWMILGTQTYSNYANEVCTPTKEIDCNNDSVTAFSTLAYDDIGLSNYGVQVEDFQYNIFDSSAGSYADYSKSKIAQEMMKFNASMGNIDKKLVAPRNVTSLKEIINKAVNEGGELWGVLSPAGRILTASFNGNQEHGKSFFINSYDFSDFAGKKYRSFATSVWSASSYNAESFIYTNLLYTADGTQGGEEVPNAAIDTNIKLAIRPSAYFDTSNFVFGVSSGTSTGLSTIKINELGDASTDLYNDSKAFQTMKLRYRNEAVTGTPIFHQIEKKNGTAIIIAATDSTVYIKAEAKAGTSDEGVNTVSALIFDKEGNFKYYRPLESAKGSAQYMFDLTGIPKGEYTISIVNEAFNSGLVTPASSSEIVGSLPLKIVDMLEIEYKADYETYTYDDNVHVTDIIGKVSFKKGEPPISFKIVATEGYENEYLNFDISPTLESDESKNINVSVKAGGPDVNTDTNSLKAGTYHFTIVGLDKDGQPLDDDGKPMATADVVLEVKKAKPTITFDSKDKDTWDIVGSKAEAVDFTEHATHTNKDIIHKKPGGNDFDILYTKASGKEGLINGLPKTSSSGGAINLSVTANQTGTVVINASIAETDNYEAAETTKTINVTLGLTAEYIEDKKNIKAGSAEAKPSDNPIGHIDVSGGKAGYTYTPIKGTNQNGSFRIDTDGKIYVDESVGEEGLTPGEYIIEIEVKDSSSTPQKTTVEKTIKVLSGKLEGVAFENPDKVSEAVSEITRTYDPSTDPEGGSFHTKLFETIDASLAGTTIEYSVEENEFLEYVNMTGKYANFNVKKATTSPIQIKAKVKGGIYGDSGAEISIPVKIEKYEQAIKFEQTSPYNLANTASCTSIPAIRKSDYWNESTTNKITYESGDEAKITIDSNGNICPVSGQTGTVTVTATLAGDDNYKEATATITINLLGELKLKYEEGTPLKQAVNPDKTGDTGNAKGEAVFGPVSVTGGLDKRYDIQIKSDDYAYSYFELKPIENNQRASSLKLKSGVSITADILKEGITKGVIVQDTDNKDQYNWKIKVLPDTDTEPQEITVHIIGADPILTFEKEVDGKLTTTYQKDGTIDLSVKRGDSVMDSGISVEGTIGYSTYIKDVSSFTTDAQLDGTGMVKANCDDDDNVLTGKDFKLTPKAEASDGYKSGTGTPTPVIIKKATHPDVDFEDPDTILSSYVQSVDKGFTGILRDDDELTIIPKDPVTWSGTEFTKTGKGDTTEPSVTITPNGFEGMITYVVNGGGNDNYKPIKDKEIHLAFAAEGGISYKPIKITYGDDTKKVIDYISDADKEKNSYTYAPVEGNKYVNDVDEELFTLNTESTITTIQVGKTKVNVTRKDEKGNFITQAIPVEIVKKEITLTYESNTIYTGEALPTPTFKEPEAGVLVGDDTIADFPIPTSATHYDGSEVLIDSETTGTYDTKGDWTSDELETEVNPNYKVTIKAGKLTIKKDTVKDNWYHLEDPEGNTVSKNDWHNYYVNVVLDTATGTAGTYDQISNTKTFTDTDKTRFTVTNEDENTEDVYFRIDPDSEVEHKGAMTSTQTTVKIDMSDPLITSITGYPVNTDGLSELINNLTFGMFYKPGVEIVVETQDPQPSGESGRAVSGVHTVSYKIYKLGEKGEFNSTQTPQTDEGKVDALGKISFKINNVGNYRICAIAKDNATNLSNERCSDVNIKKIDVDIDGDGTNDFVDTDKNGCPDLNIILGKDKDGNPVKLNVAEKNKTYPYMNIDSNGDGKADLNIDTDHDGKPDLNLVDLSKETPEGGLSAWKPKICVVVEKLKDYTDPIEYCTGTDAKAVINVDTTGNRIPDINIDTDGDFIADYNIDTDGDKEPDLNVGKKHTTWIPDHDYEVDGFIYDSIGEHKPLINIDTNGDGKPDVNIDLDGDGSADINIDTTGNGVPNINIDGDGDGEPDYNLDANEDGKPTKNVIILDEWKPDTDGKYQNKEFDTMHLEGKTEVSDSGIVIEKSDGKFLPNTAIKVNDISLQLDEKVKSEIDKVAGDKEIKKVYDVNYIESNSSKQPDGSVKVKIPVDESIKNPSILVEKEDGTFEEVKVTKKDGYYVFETEYLGKVCVIADKENTEPAPTPAPTPDAGTSNTQNPSTSVKGNYTNDNKDGIGGAITGDETNVYGYIRSITFALSISWLAYVSYKRKETLK